MDVSFSKVPRKRILRGVKFGVLGQADWTGLLSRSLGAFRSILAASRADMQAHERTVGDSKRPVWSKTTMDLGFRMHAERTPNPNSIKWVLGQAVAGDAGSASFSGDASRPGGDASHTGGDASRTGGDASSVGSREGHDDGDGADVVDVEVSPLAAAILEVEGVVGVYLGPTFVTVTKTESSEWTDLAAPIVAGIKAWAATGEPALGPAYEAPKSGDNDEIADKIRMILERDVRPYVEQDGGEISFAGYRDGIVEVVLQGACAGCPSSSITLKMGIEARLKDEIPEIKSVVAL
jgi:Fe-S cluster biogenesis protein NfuA